MHQAAVQNAVLHISSLAVGRELPLAEAAVAFATVMHVKCTMRSVQPAVVRRKYPFSREKIDRFIAVIATNRSVLLIPTTEDRTGSLHDSNYSESWRFV